MPWIDASSSAGWKPRLALWFNYATGDRHADDGKSQRFDSLYGDNFSFYSYAGYFTSCKSRPPFAFEVHQKYMRRPLASELSAKV